MTSPGFTPAGSLDSRMQIATAAIASCKNDVRSMTVPPLFGVAPLRSRADSTLELMQPGCKIAGNASVHFIGRERADGQVGQSTMFRGGHQAEMQRAAN